MCEHIIKRKDPIRKMYNWEQSCMNFFDSYFFSFKCIRIFKGWKGVSRKNKDIKIICELIDICMNELFSILIKLYNKNIKNIKN